MNVKTVVDTQDNTWSFEIYDSSGTEILSDYGLVDSDAAYAGVEKVCISAVTPSMDDGMVNYVDDVSVSFLSPSAGCSEIKALGLNNRADTNGDCLVDFRDFADIAGDWQE